MNVDPLEPINLQALPAGTTFKLEGPEASTEL